MLSSSYLIPSSNTPHQVGTIPTFNQVPDACFFCGLNPGPQPDSQARLSNRQLIREAARRPNPAGAGFLIVSGACE
jgi:hypothetical protein